MKREPVKDHAERKRVLALIERCEKEQTMSDLIKREDVIATIGVMYERCDTYDITDYRDLMLEAVKVLPSADRPQGYWTNRHKWDNGFVERECSLCGAMKPILMHTAKINYCLNCGARMKGADDE